MARKSTGTQKRIRRSKKVLIPGTPEYEKYQQKRKERAEKRKLKAIENPNIFTFGCLTQDIADILDEFNNSVKYIFTAEDRVLVPADPTRCRAMDVKGIIIYHNNTSDKFQEDFDKYKSVIDNMANKLDKRTTIYENRFKTEFSDIDSWILKDNQYIAYNCLL